MPARIKFVLNEPRNPKNIGAAARGMANFGFRSLAVVKPYSKAWRETRSAVKAAPVVEKAKKYATLKAALRGSHLVIGTSAGSRRTLPEQWIGLEELAQLVSQNARARKGVALLFGSERSGLSNEDLAHCHYVLRIPTAPECPSMNLAQAVAVVACAIRADGMDPKSLPSRVESPESVTVEHVERLVGQALKAAGKARLLGRWDAAQSEMRFRKMLYRWNLTPVDAAILHGLFGWVLKHKERS